MFSKKDGERNFINKEEIFVEEQTVYSKSIFWYSELRDALLFDSNNVIELTNKTISKQKHIYRR